MVMVSGAWHWRMLGPTVFVLRGSFSVLVRISKRLGIPNFAYFRASTEGDPRQRVRIIMDITP